MSLQAILPENFLIDSDTYKQVHWWLIPSDITNAYSVISARKPFVVVEDGIKVIEIDEIVMAGGQILVKYLQTVTVTTDLIDEAEEEASQQGCEFPRHLWEQLEGKKLPLIVKAIPDGSIVPVGVPLVSFESADESLDLAWLISYAETVSQRYIWKSCTVASITRAIKKILKQGMLDTAGHIEGLDWMFHNFGDRSSDAGDAATIAGIAHLQMFNGTDCLKANRYIKKIFNTTNAYGSSIAASEHSVSCMNADAENRDDINVARRCVDWLEHEVKRLGGFAMVSSVIDTYDAFRFARDYIGGDELRTRIEQSGGRMVLRPDSGCPITVPCDIVEILMDKFGFTINSNGFRVLPNCVRVLQGDGVGLAYFPKIIEECKKRKISLENFAFGCGGGITHEHGRDTFSFAQKATGMKRLDKWIDLFKDPITDPGKRSHRGVVSTFKDSQGNIISERVSILEFRNDLVDLMVTVYNDGVLYNEQDFDQVRARCFEV